MWRYDVGQFCRTCFREIFPCNFCYVFFWMFSILLKPYFPSLLHRPRTKLSLLMKRWNHRRERSLWPEPCSYRLAGYFNHQPKHRSPCLLLKPSSPLGAVFCDIKELFDKIIPPNELQHNRHLRWRLILKETGVLCLVFLFSLPRLCLSAHPWGMSNVQICQSSCDSMPATPFSKDNSFTWFFFVCLFYFWWGFFVCFMGFYMYFLLLLFGLFCFFFLTKRGMPSLLG